MNIVNEIREKQNQLITMINTTFDDIVKRVEELEISGNESNVEYESIYPITNTTGFKGNKPIDVLIGNERMITPTWKVVVKRVLEEVMKDNEMKKRLFELRDKLLGRVRRRISSEPNEMRSPLKLCEELYVETHYDTETLMNLLLQILYEISYDSSNIKVVIKTKKS